MMTKKLLIKCNLLMMVGIALCPLHLAASNVGKVYPSEKKTIVDRTTGNVITVLTSSPFDDTKPYQTHTTWTADGNWIIFRSERSGNGSQAFLVNELTGTIIQLTDDPHVSSGAHITLSRKEMKMFYQRRTQAAGKNITELLELNIGDLITDALAGKVATGYERIIATIPDVRVEGLALDADESCLYWGVHLEYAQDKEKVPHPTMPDINNDYRSEAFLKYKQEYDHWTNTISGAGKSVIRKTNIKTGKTGDVVEFNFRLGHLQANPWTPGEILYCKETGGDADQRTWVVRSDGTNNRPAYVETPDEWVTHETVSSPDEMMFIISGNRPDLLFKPSGIGTLDLRTNQMRLIGQVDEVFWHCNGSPDRKWAVGDTHSGSIYLIDRENGKRTLLSAGHPMEPDHTHPIFSPDSKRVLIQSGVLTDGKILNLMEISVPEK
jgi:oligogalacturonide lyase